MNRDKIMKKEIMMIFAITHPCFRIREPVTKEEGFLKKYLKTLIDSADR